MEAQKPNMPPPPKKLANMPPPPPVFPPKPKTEEIATKIEPKNEIPAVEPVVEAIKQPVDPLNKPIEESSTQVVLEADLEQELPNNEVPQKSEIKKVKKQKMESKGGWKTALYWIGLVVSVAAIAVLVFLLIK